MSEPAPDIRKGLVGVYADESSVSKVMPETNSLTYRGYAVQDLCEESNFEEVAYLLWHGELPNAAQLAAFQAEERANRALSPALLRVLREFPHNAHPMDAIDHRLALGLRSLSAADLRLVALVMLEGYTVTDAAVVLGLTPAGTKTRLHRARLRLRAAMGEMASTSSVTVPERGRP